MPYVKEMDKLVLDTNSLIQCLPLRSRYHDLWVSFLDGRNYICVSNEILDEYEEILEMKTSHELASSVIKVLLNNPYTLFCTPFFNFNLIENDPDDNKFVDCAVSAGAKFIVTEDRHFNVLKKIDFPKVEIIGLVDIIKRYR